MRCVGLKLLMGETDRFGGCTAIHSIIGSTDVHALSQTASRQSGIIFIGANGIAGTTMIRIVSMDVDANIFAVYRTNGFIRIWAGDQRTRSMGTGFIVRTGDKTAAGEIGSAIIRARIRIDTGAVTNHFTGLTIVFALAATTEFFCTAFGVDGTAGIMGIFFTYYPFDVIAVKAADLMVSGFTFVGETLF